MAAMTMVRVIAALASWQTVGGVFQIHPGDIGWQWRFGATATARAIRTWDVDGVVGAVGFVDGPTLRLAIDPAHARDAGLAAQIVAGIPAEAASVEAPAGSLVRELLDSHGWRAGEEWVPLERELIDPVEDSGLSWRISQADTAHDRVLVQRAAFESSTFTIDHWLTMAQGPAYAAARCLVGYDETGLAVAAVTVWSAGEGRPGLLEPLGVHHEHRGLGYGRAASLAAASVLRELGCGSALVGTPKANGAAVATYASAGFVARSSVSDLERP